MNIKSGYSFLSLASNLLSAGSEDCEGESFVVGLEYDIVVILVKINPVCT
jgi:hypothetical protein